MPKPGKLISPAALTRLQTVYSQFARRSFDLTGKREDRLAWASMVLEKPVTSFSNLTSAEAATLTNNLQNALGIRETAPPRRQRSKAHGQKLGTEGRRDQIHAETTMVDGTEDVFRLIQHELTVLGWDEAGLRRFLVSRSGPNEGRATIRTLKDANRVHWALKQIAKRAAAKPAKGVAE